MGAFESATKLPGASNIRIRHQGEFELQKVTDAILNYLQHKGYMINYKDQTESPKPDGMEAKYEWLCDRQPIPYLKFYIDILIYTYHVKDIIVEEEGKQKKIQSGDINIVIEGRFEKNYDKSFPSTKLGEFFRKLYEKYVAYDTLMGYWGKIYQEMTDVLEEAKKALELHTRG